MYMYTILFLAFITVMPLLLRIFLSLSLVLQVSTPSFNQTSYQEYSLPSPISFTTYISLSFHPTSLNGLILYIGDVSMSRDFLSLSLVSGRVELRYDLGSGPAIIMSSSVIPLNQWTSVTVDKVRRDGMLVVNGSSTNGSSPGTTTMLNAVGGLYIGGGAGGVGGYQVSPNAGTEVGLTGCVNTATLRVSTNILFIAFCVTHVRTCTSTCMLMLQIISLINWYYIAFCVSTAFQLVINNRYI